MRNNETIAYIGSLVGILGFCGTMLMYYRGQIEKAYADKRELIHLKNNMAQLSQNMNQLGKDLEEEVEDLKLLILDIKSMLYAGLKSKEKD